MEGQGSGSGFLRALGPGVLFTGAAVGVSHLVQSTRAGAVYGLGLVLVVLAANLVKYPAFRFGPQYAATTNTSLLEGYRRQGRWALSLYGLLTLATMFTVQAAVTLVTAGLAKSLLGLDTSPLVLSAVLLALCGALLAYGRYHWLDRVSKVVVSVHVISTVAAALMAIPAVDWSQMPLSLPWGELANRDIFFIAAVVGWMPSAIDVSVWQSLWTLAREKDTGHRPSLHQSMVDFHLGYWGTAVLALCFLGLGAGVIYGRGVELSDTAGGFAAQIVELYALTLGEWSRPVIALSAFATMFSTTLTVVDGFPRALSVLFARFRGPEAEGGAEEDRQANRKVYWGALVLLALGSVGIIAFMLGSLKAMVDIATTLSFLTAPILAWLNHRAVLAPHIPPDKRPASWLIWASRISMFVLAVFALYYVVIRFLS